MVVLEQTSEISQEHPALPAGGQGMERPAIGELLRSLRGGRTLRQVEADTGVSNAYLCNLGRRTQETRDKDAGQAVRLLPGTPAGPAPDGRPGYHRQGGCVPRIGTGRAEELRLRHSRPRLQATPEAPGVTLHRLPEVYRRYVPVLHR